MRIYFDTCIICRPFDNQQNISVYQETIAILEVIKKIEAGYMELYLSSANEYEYGKIISRERYFWFKKFKELATGKIEINDKINVLAFRLNSSGIKPLDSLHLACAEYGKSDFLLTVDKIFINSAKKVSTDCKVINPLDFLGMELKK